MQILDEIRNKEVVIHQECKLCVYVGMNSRNIICNDINSLAVLSSNFVMQVGSVERRSISVFVRHTQGTDRVIHNLFIGSGRQGHDWYIGILSSETPQVVIIWSKVMSPVIWKVGKWKRTQRCVLAKKTSFKMYTYYNVTILTNHSNNVPHPQQID